MMIQEQLGKPQEPYQPVSLLAFQTAAYAGLLGNESSQLPTTLAAADTVVETPRSQLRASPPTFKLSLLKLQKFTRDGRERRIAASLAALNASQPTELSLEEWKEIVEEVEDDED